jgi:sporulation protein YlmC with PRC-barrel domain
MSADTLKGDKVRNWSGEDLGKIEDFMIDLGTGRIRYAVLSFGGVLGMGSKLFAAPPEVLTIDTENECLVMDVEKEALKDAPGFDKDSWPNFADPTFGRDVYQYYGHRPYWR